MYDKNNPLQTVELSTEQNTNMIDGIINNTPPQLPQPEDKSPDKVRERPNPRRTREREER